MKNIMKEPSLIVIVGPTAVGKTELSIQLAERLDAEIVSADSRYFYRGMDIGTAKPKPADMARVPHHMIDVANPDETWSLALFQEQAQKTIYDVSSRGKLAFLVGGTGQYIRCITDGWQIPKKEADPQLRNVLNKWAEDIGAQGLHDRLAVLDPQMAKKIDYRNLRRTVRALEVILSTGRRFSRQRKRGKPLYRTLQIGLNRPRKVLYNRIDRRIKQMLAAGFVEEVKTLLAQGYQPDLPAFSAIGYRQIVQYLQGDISLEEAITLIKRLTRTFVRRQANWFKADDPNIHWLTVESNSVDEMERLVRAFLEKTIS
jgi:tRNA dimethylallyltransferase